MKKKKLRSKPIEWPMVTNQWKTIERSKKKKPDFHRRTFGHGLCNNYALNRWWFGFSGQSNWRKTFFLSLLNERWRKKNTHNNNNTFFFWAMNLPDKIMKREKKNSNSSIKYELDSIIMRFQTCFHSIHSTSSIVISTIVTSFFFIFFIVFLCFFFLLFLRFKLSQEI